VHGYTYSGHPVAAAVALEVLKIYEEMDLVGGVQAMEPTFLKVFGALTGHPLVGEFAGIGLIGGIELVQDKLTRRSFPADRGVGKILDANAQKRGLILRLIGDRVALSPPLVISAAELHDMAERLRLALDDTLTEIEDKPVKARLHTK
jgi:4-aminobutyrate---pyruvate transaminase